MIMLFGHTLFGQSTVSGKVLDAQTKAPLAFVNIIFNDQVQTGTTTNINGQFAYSSNEALTSLTCSYVGYEKITVRINADKTGIPFLILMKAASIALGEVVVRAGENPANRIIRKVIENKSVNNPENITSFTCRSYNKVIYDIEYGDNFDDLATKAELDDVFQGGHVMIMESVTKRKFIRPDNNEEIVLGTKVSGFKAASFAILATDIQPFSFYSDIIPILDVEYLNPISNGSLSKYDFNLADTLYQGLDTIFILSYKPRQGKNFEGLTGLLYINTNQYAIQNVIARPDQPGFIDVNITQQYQYVDDKQWFPEQLKFDMFMRQDPDMKMGVRASGVSIIDSVKLNADLRKKDFGLVAISMDDTATRQDSVFWNNHRASPLDEKEMTTYQVLDSLGKKYKFDKILNIMESVGRNKFPLSFIDLDINRFASFNKYEGVRLGLGVHTNDNLIKNFSVGGYTGYGFRDHSWKYGADVTLSLDKNKDWQISVKHLYDLRETGKSTLGYFNPREFNFRAYLAEQMDIIQQSSASLTLRAFRYARANISLNSTRVDPQYPYVFKPGDGELTPTYVPYTTTDVAITVRYAYKEKLMETMGQRISMGTRYPVLSLTYTRGIKDWFDSDFDFHKFEARLEQSVYFRNLGESKIRINAGIVDSPLPYGLLFTGEGSFVRNWSVLVKNSFQTVRPYEFLSDRYFSLHYAHNFGSLLLHIGKFKPSISLLQNLGWGTLSHPEYHEDINFKTKEKGLYETGLQLDNLVRIKYLNVSYLGFGAGIYCRYGPYATKNVSDDVSFTFSMTFTTK